MSYEFLRADLVRGFLLFFNLPLVVEQVDEANLKAKESRRSYYVCVPRLHFIRYSESTAIFGCEHLRDVEGYCDAFEDILSEKYSSHCEESKDSGNGDRV